MKRAGLLALTVFCAGAALADPLASEIAAGEAAFQAKCLRCHRQTEPLLRATADLSPEQEAARLMAVLQTHHNPGPEAAAAIAAWLASL